LEPEVGSGFAEARVGVFDAHGGLLGLVRFGRVASRMCVNEERKWLVAGRYLYTMESGVQER
jgi:hypothetical protein